MTEEEKRLAIRRHQLMQEQVQIMRHFVASAEGSASLQDDYRRELARVEAKEVSLRNLLP